jgi:chromosome segregation ATPase
MVQQVKHPDEAGADLGKPGELLSLDVASYAAGLASDNEIGESRRVSDTSWDESRPHPLAELPPIETLRQIEAWIAAQDVRARANNRVVAELESARADAEARAANLALELEVAQKALHTAPCRANDAERADFAATIDKLHAELAERDAAIAHLKAEHTAQSTAFAELAAARSREQQSSAVRQEEVRAAAETLATEIQALEERYRRSTESVATREAELAESRAARTALEETLRTVQTNDSAHAARVSELEALATDLGHALQAQTEATKRANASTETRERELADEHGRSSALEAQLQAATRHATDQSAAAQWTETELKMHLEQLAASQGRLANFEREATYQSEWLANLQVELAHAEVRAEQAEASRRRVENELAHVRTELQRETERARALDVTQRELVLELERGRTELQRDSERAKALDATQRELALELERRRGALDEREFQLRRLERDANTSAQALSGINVGSERGNSNSLSDTVEFPDDGATLVPLDDSDAPAVPLGRHTTIGRARESDLCLKDSSVSRRHAVVTIEPNGAFIEDLRSVNGVSVNGQRIRHARITDGDVIELGVRRFRFTSCAAERNARSAM